MDVFISWSGDRSRRCAEALRAWMPRVIQSVKPWISTHDLAKGSRWESVLAKELGNHLYGIICVTPENRESPWLNYEAGALSKTDSSRTFTLLVGLSYAEVQQPLAQFNHTLATKAEMLALVRSINEASEFQLSDELLMHSFETNWNFMEEVFANIIAEKPPAEPARQATTLRDERSILEEILETVRIQYRKDPPNSSLVDPDPAGLLTLIRDTVGEELVQRSILLPFNVSFVDGNRYSVSIKRRNGSEHVFPVTGSDTRKDIATRIDAGLLAVGSKPSKKAT